MWGGNGREKMVGGLSWVYSVTSTFEGIYHVVTAPLKPFMWILSAVWAKPVMNLQNWTQSSSWTWAQKGDTFENQWFTMDWPWCAVVPFVWYCQEDFPWPMSCNTQWWRDRLQSLQTRCHRATTHTLVVWLSFSPLTYWPTNKPTLFPWVHRKIPAKASMQTQTGTCTTISHTMLSHSVTVSLGCTAVTVSTRIRQELNVAESQNATLCFHCLDKPFF